MIFSGSGMFQMISDDVVGGPYERMAGHNNVYLIHFDAYSKRKYTGTVTIHSVSRNSLDLSISSERHSKGQSMNLIRQEKK